MLGRYDMYIILDWRLGMLPIYLFWRKRFVIFWYLWRLCRIAHFGVHTISVQTAINFFFCCQKPKVSKVRNPFPFYVYFFPRLSYSTGRAVIHHVNPVRKPIRTRAKSTVHPVEKIPSTKFSTDSCISPSPPPIPKFHSKRDIFFISRNIFLFFFLFDDTISYGYRTRFLSISTLGVFWRVIFDNRAREYPSSLLYIHTRSWNLKIGQYNKPFFNS